MNEIMFSIKNPYTGEEALPTDDRIEMELEHHCFEPIMTQNIERIYLANEKGYTFRTKPCFCFVSDTKFEKRSDNIFDLFSYDALDTMKKNILHNDYSLCKQINCSAYESYKRGSTSAFTNWSWLIKNYGMWGKELYFKHGKIDNYPLHTLALNISPVCNYKCKTCRDEYITEEVPLTDNDFNDIIKAIKSVKCVRLGCDGEIFLSKIYKRILSIDLTEDSNLKKIVIFTNGSLANKTNIASIHKNNLSLIKEFRISIDAATPETFAVTRNKNTWDTVIANIKSLNEMKQEYNFKLATVFTISKYNVCDVYKFIDFAEDLGFTDIGFAFAQKRFHGKDEDFFIPNDKRDDIIAFIDNISYKNNRKASISLH